MMVNFCRQKWLQVAFVFWRTASAFTADIRADSNRDGIVDIHGNTDLVHKHECSNAAGAVFLPNIGDTDRRCSKLSLQQLTLPSNEELAACNDASDEIQRAPQFMAPLRTMPIPNISDDASGYVLVDDKPVAKRNARIFRRENDQWIYTTGEHKFAAPELREGLQLGIDARDTRRPGTWDGGVTVQFIVQDGSDTSMDSVRLRVAPVLSHHHGQYVTEVFTTAGNKSYDIYQEKFTSDLAAIMDQRDLSYPLYQFNYSVDTWAQDFVEPGYTSMPGPDNQTITLGIMIRSAQDDRVAGRQVFENLRDTGRGAVQHLGGSRNEINSMGNFETIPPYTHGRKSYPAGRIILGAHGELTPWVYEYIKAQEVQDPILLDTDWLAIGHVDEMVQFLPSASNSSSYNWNMLVADPVGGLEVLQHAHSMGHGSTRAFSRHNNDTAPLPVPGGLPDGVPNITIAEVLSDSDLVSANARFSYRIESNIDILKRETGIPASNIHRVPAIFKTGHIYPSGAGIPPSRNASAEHAASLYPGAINGVVFPRERVYLAPRQWGPVIHGRDIFGEAVTEVYEKLGYQVVYIDNWNSHHQWGGEVHCATNTVRDGRLAWWKG